MLVSLHVKNLALIEEAEVDFSRGLNIMSGETGAGKSIIIGSITLALGAKADANLIRNGAEYALIELVFQTKDQSVLMQMQQEELPVEEDGIIIFTRKIQHSRSSYKINGETVTAKQVKKISEGLLDIHGQHEHQSLLHKEKYMEILDSYAGSEITLQLQAYQIQYHNLKKLKTEYQESGIDEASRIREMELASFEINEIETAAICIGEDAELEKKYQFMLHSKKIAEVVSVASGMLEAEEDMSVGSQIGRALRELRSVINLDDKLQELEGQLEEIDGLLSDFGFSISTYMNTLEFEESEFEILEDRLNELNHLKAKYGNTLEKVLAYKEEKENLLVKLQDYDTYRQNLLIDIGQLEDHVYEQAENMSQIRQIAAKELSDRLKKALKDLNFLHVAFQIDVKGKKEQLGVKGFDQVTFMISTNPGEKPAPVHMIASGGELSRVMLALKTVLADRDEIETLIFDEIDTGISGKTAWKVSEKLGTLSKGHQVICITHLPQIAAMADTHFYIEKTADNSSTVTSISKLSCENQINELARMLGGDIISHAAVENAKELLETAQKAKS